MCPPDSTWASWELRLTFPAPSLAGWGPRGVIPLGTWEPNCHVPPLPLLVSWPPLSLDLACRGGRSIGHHFSLSRFLGVTHYSEWPRTPLSHRPASNSSLSLEGWDGGMPFLLAKVAKANFQTACLFQLSATLFSIALNHPCCFSGIKRCTLSLWTGMELRLHPVTSG